jgi:hypothetical protein
MQKQVWIHFCIFIIKQKCWYMEPLYLSCICKSGLGP